MYVRGGGDIFMEFNVAPLFQGALEEREREIRKLLMEKEAEKLKKLEVSSCMIYTTNDCVVLGNTKLR